MIRLENVSKKLKGFYLENISFELPKGYIMGIVGENGSGKTTLINIISGLYSIDKGRIQFCAMNYDRDERDIKEQIGTIIHGDIFDLHETLMGNGRRYGRFYKNYNENILERYAKRFRLDTGKKYKQLSKGEKLKFATAFALSHNPKLLLLDEPTANFDKEFRKDFLDVLREFTEDGDNSVILATHIMSDIEKVADYLLILEDGKQVIYGDIEKVRSTYRMVAGEEYKIKLLRNRVIHMEKGDFGSKALVLNSTKPFDKALKVWEPSIEELMYFTAKKGM